MLLRWWSGRSSPERFDFYTRASLYGLFAAGPLVALALAGQKQVPGTRPDRLPAAVRGAGERLHRAAARQPVLLPGQGATAEEVAGGLSCRADRGRGARGSRGLPCLHPAPGGRVPGEFARGHALLRRAYGGAHAAAERGRAGRCDPGERGRGQWLACGRRRLSARARRGVHDLCPFHRRARGRLPRLRRGAAGAGASRHALAGGFMIYALFIGGYVVDCRGSAWTLRIMWELDRSRAVQARLSVAEERLRFARDLHDVLGRNLSLIAVTSELAGQLARRGDEEAAAAGHMIEVRRVAHESLREMRAVISGYRTADLDTELAGAQDVLRSAGVRCRIIGDAAGRRSVRLDFRERFTTEQMPWALAMLTRALGARWAASRAPSCSCWSASSC